ncbi:toprim domain-containing protein [Candidatus Pacearchaeota archaeon]|nr:toprim domain-containing protein [Candidatus Pacearchaeota archaeon]
MLSTIETYFKKVKYQNGEFLTYCPYCPDKKGHLTINLKKKLYHCYRCGRGGKLEELLNEQGINGVYFGNVKESFKDRKTILNGKINLTLIPILHNNSHIAKIAYEYIKGRGISDEIIERYLLSYTDDKKYLGMLIIPFFEDGKLVYFTTRRFLGKGKKTLHPAKEEINKASSQVLFNYEHLKNEVIIVEGPFDCLKMLSLGFKNTTCLLGSYFSDEHIKLLLKKKINHIILMLDSDKFKESLLLTQKLISYFDIVEVVKLEKGDPGDFETEYDYLKLEKFKFTNKLEVSITLKNL